jgi:hypothetical protein
VSDLLPNSKIELSLQAKALFVGIGLAPYRITI